MAKREIEIGSLVVPVSANMSALRMAFPNEALSDKFQFRVTSIVGRSVYKRRCYMLQSKPGGPVVAVWGTHVRLLSSKVAHDERWKGPKAS